MPWEQIVESRSRDDAAQDFGWRSRTCLERNLTSYLQQVFSYSTRPKARASVRFPDQANKFSDAPI